MTNKKDTIEINKNTLTTGAIIVLAILLAVSIFTGGFSNCSATNDKNVAPDEAPSINMKSLMDDDAIDGDEEAEITIVEFSDYECPFCARFYDQTLGQIRENYVDTGKVKIIFRDFPLSFHKNAQKASEAAECAGEQGEYYAMHDKLFEDGVDGGVDSFKAYAKVIGLDSSKFDECLDSGAMAKEVAKDMADGQAAGVQGTPAFIIDGKLISGAQPYAVFQQAIDEALAN